MLKQGRLGLAFKRTLNRADSGPGVPVAVQIRVNSYLVKERRKPHSQADAGPLPLSRSTGPEIL